MVAAPISIGPGQTHFQQLENQHLTSFSQNTFFIDVAGDITPEGLLDPGVWGPQPKLRRGDRVTVMRVDNAWLAELVVWSTAAAYPQMRLMQLVEAGAVALPALMSEPNRCEFQVGAGWVVIVNHQIAASRLPNEPTARAKLAELTGAAA